MRTSKTVNVIVGNNNSGKSTILKSIYHLQGYNFLSSDRTLDSAHSLITIGLETIKGYYYFNNFPNNPYNTDTVEDVKVKFKFVRSQGRDEIDKNIEMLNRTNNRSILSVNFDPYLPTTNENLIYPYFSNRKTNNYSKSIKRSDREKIEDNLNNLQKSTTSLRLTEIFLNCIVRLAKIYWVFS